MRARAGPRPPRAARSGSPGPRPAEAPSRPSRGLKTRHPTTRLGWRPPPGTLACDPSSWPCPHPVEALSEWGGGLPEVLRDHGEPPPPPHTRIPGHQVPGPGPPYTKREDPGPSCSPIPRSPPPHTLVRSSQPRCLCAVGHTHSSLLCRFQLPLSVGSGLGAPFPSSSSVPTGKPRAETSAPSPPHPPSLLARGPQVVSPERGTPESLCPWARPRRVSARGPASSWLLHPLHSAAVQSQPPCFLSEDPRALHRL